MSTTDLHVITALNAGVLSITFDHPKANALTLEMIAAISAAFKQAERDPQIRCVLLSGRGANFSAGQDVMEIQQAVDTSFRSHLLHTYNPLVLQIRKLEKPVLAAINGTVSGAALGLALACDLRIAADTARIVVGFLGIGLAPDSGVSLFLPALIGLGRASEYLFTNAPIDAGQALALGLFNRLVPASELPERASELAASLAQGPQHAIGLTKRALNKAVLGNLEVVLDYEAHLQDIAGRGAELKEGVQAFLEKRPARFGG
jgi:2-(1,2-epoxy-1,2-dihydrophenyl)acetyl-CoA isomerase